MPNPTNRKRIPHPALPAPFSKNPMEAPAWSRKRRDDPPPGARASKFVRSSSHLAVKHETVRALERGGIRPVIDRSFGLDTLGEAFQYEQSGAHFGKIVVEW